MNDTSIYRRYKARFPVRLWRDIVWYLKRFIDAFPDFIAGFAFGCLVSLIPIVAAFMIR